MSQNKGINENLRTFNFMQNKKRLIANILKVKTFDQTGTNFFQHIKNQLRSYYLLRVLDM